MPIHLQHREATIEPVEKAPSSLPPPTMALATTDPVATEPKLGPIIAVATVAVSLLLMVSITVGLAAGEHTGWIDGLGVALFAAFWGGPGFGLIFGGAYWIHLHERWEAQQTALGATAGS